MINDLLCLYFMVGLSKAILTFTMSWYAGIVSWKVANRYGRAYMPLWLWVALSIVFGVLVSLVLWPIVLRLEGRRFFVIARGRQIMREAIDHFIR